MLHHIADDWIHFFGAITYLSNQNFSMNQTYEMRFAICKVSSSIVGGAVTPLFEFK